MRGVYEDADVPTRMLYTFAVLNAALMRRMRRRGPRMMMSADPLLLIRSLMFLLMRVKSFRAIFCQSSPRRVLGGWVV